jgi:hypothetical protein
MLENGTVFQDRCWRRLSGPQIPEFARIIGKGIGVEDERRKAQM